LFINPVAIGSGMAIFKDGKELVLRKYKNNQNYRQNCRINPFGYRILKSIDKKISKHMEIAALIIVLVYPREMGRISLSTTMKR
jgi:hypothetical protein